MAQPYEILGISKNPMWEEVHNAFKKLCVAYHPDMHPGEEEMYNEKMAEINAAYDYYKTYLNRKVEQDFSNGKRKAYKDYTPEEKKRAWEEMQEEWKRRSHEDYKESGRKMRAKIARNLDPILNINKKFQAEIVKCTNYYELFEVSKAYADKINEMIHTMYEYTEKQHRYGMPPNHEYHTEVYDKNVDKDYPLVKVESSKVNAVGYDENNRLLYIQFHGGAVYVYYEIVKYVYDGFLKAASKGKYFGEYIKKAGYKYTKLK